MVEHGNVKPSGHFRQLVKAANLIRYSRGRHCLEFIWWVTLGAKPANASQEYQIDIPDNVNPIALTAVTTLISLRFSVTVFSSFGS